MRQHVFALVDCMSFYVSCERVFQAALHNKPTVVLSNNDGNIVALDALAKSLGLKRGQPFFQCQKIIHEHGVQVYSSNYSMYADMSARVMHTLAEFSPRLEVYSIDEGWLDLTGVATDDLTELGRTIQARVRQYTGIPTRVTIASSKCLTKIACELVRGDPEYGDVLDLTGFTAQQMDEALAQVAIEDVFGIGRKYARFLRNYGIATARDVRDADERWIRKHLTVVGARIQLELKGISCFPLETGRPPKQQMINAKSFGKELTSREEMEEAVADYVAHLAEKLRKQDSLASRLTVFLQTNGFDKEASQYANSFTVDLAYPTAFTPELIRQAIIGLHAIYEKGFRYKKVGIMLSRITPLPVVQPDLFSERTLTKYFREMRLMMIVDALNSDAVFGPGTLIFAAQGTARRWKMRQDHLSGHFTTRWEELLTI